jgi:predicted nucleic acid-binding protein
LNVLFDSGSLINLAHGQVLGLLAKTPLYEGYVAPLVLGECKSIADDLAYLMAMGTLIQLPDLTMGTADFAALLAKHRLGAGETECLVMASTDGYVVSCDDGTARGVLSKSLGVEKVTGTLGLLIMAVQAELLSVSEAFASYQQMRALGGYLPALTGEEFKALV